MKKITFLLIFNLTFSLVWGQKQNSNTNFIAIDHIPIVVDDLTAIKKELVENLHFTIKEGKVHEGIKNCFIKFQDGTYLEFMTPIDRSQRIGKYYSDFLKNRQGGTSLVISVKNADTLSDFLRKANFEFETEHNKIWKTVEPKNLDLFFIEYADPTWRDSKSNTSHRNTALSLTSTYIIDTKEHFFENLYKKLGFRESKTTKLLGITCQSLLIGKSRLFLLEAPKAKQITSNFKTQNFKGICGFEIKVDSLKKLENTLSKSTNIWIEKERIFYFFTDYCFFFEFTE